MKRFALCISFIIVMVLASQAMAQGNAAKGKQLASQCAACHGPKGNGLNPDWPKIAGQNQKYMVQQLLDYKKGPEGRNNPIMYGIAQNLSDQDIKDLAAYFALQEVKPGAADPKLVKLGAKIYRGGIMEKGVPSCAACHGPKGAGNAEAAFPQIGGQYAKYIVLQLNEYKQGKRKNDMMNVIAKKMNEKDIQAVASYIQGLH